MGDKVEEQITRFFLDHWSTCRNNTNKSNNFLSFLAVKVAESGEIKYKPIRVNLKQFIPCFEMFTVDMHQHKLVEPILKFFLPPWLHFYECISLSNVEYTHESHHILYYFVHCVHKLTLHKLFWWIYPQKWVLCHEKSKSSTVSNILCPYFIFLFFSPLPICVSLSLSPATIFTCSVFNDAAVMTP